MLCMLMRADTALTKTQRARRPCSQAVEDRGYSLIASRRLFTCVGFLVSAAALLPVFSYRELSPWVSTAAFALANTFFGLAPSGFKSNCASTDHQTRDEFTRCILLKASPLDPRCAQTSTSPSGTLA